MANIQQRTGGVVVRVGGNTQDTASLVDSTPDGRILEKDLNGITNPVRLNLARAHIAQQTPSLMLFYF